ncbi:MAG: MBL fold metallo-hydrolase [Acidobacteriota bacterium]|nr:MBL fold metallo-hydrolase [Acidobacteriota bacterium]
MEEIARDVAVVPMMLVNAYLVGTAQSWVLVDSGTPGNTKKIKEAAEARFGPNTRPNALILTHGHFDHAGSASDLGKLWNVKVYAHRLEWPFLTGRSPYPPMDPTAPGFFAALSRFFPSRTTNVADRIADLNGSLPGLGLSDWEAIDTPGHTPGHVSFFRRSDGVLLAGDAFATVNMDNLLTLLTKKPQIYRPPVPATTDWQKARASVQFLAALRPRVIGAGHGSPMANAADQLESLAANFPVPQHGRYVQEPARFDENGIAYLPPAPPDRTPKIAAGVAIGAVLAAAGASMLRKKA